MGEKKFIYIIGFVSLASWLVHLLFYANHYIKRGIFAEGIVFISIIFPVYFALAKVYYIWQFRKK